MRKYRFLFLAILLIASLAVLNSCGKDEGDPGGGDPANPDLKSPSDLVASVISDSEIKLSWVDNSDSETGFKVERSLSAGDGFAVMGNVSADVNSYRDEGLEASTKYYYRVRAFNAIGYTSYTAVVTATTNADPGNGGPDPVEVRKLAHIWIETCVDHLDVVITENGLLKWNTPWMKEGNAYRPGTHPDCARLGQSHTYVKVNDKQFTLPLDSVYWKKFVEGSSALRVARWEGTFDLSKLSGIDLNVIEDKADNIESLVKIEGRGSIGISGQNQLNISDPGDGPAVYEFEYDYDYYAME